jgi:hypothetical protein
MIHVEALIRQIIPQILVAHVPRTRFGTRPRSGDFVPQFHRWIPRELRNRTLD